MDIETPVDAQVGAIIPLPEGAGIPDRWHLCDATELPTHEWPDFAFEVAIAGPTFTLPDLPGNIILLGTHVESPTLVAPVADSPLFMLLKDVFPVVEPPPLPPVVDDHSQDMLLLEDA